MNNDIDIEQLKRLHAAAEVGVGTQRDIAVAMNAAYRHLPQLIARLEAAEEAMQWRPIEEAQKTPWVKVLGYCDKQGVLIMRWAPSAEGSINFAKGHPGDWITDDDTFIMPCKPTHYMPLPAPPEAAR